MPSDGSGASRSPRRPTPAARARQGRCSRRPSPRTRGSCSAPAGPPARRTAWSRRSPCPAPAAPPRGCAPASAAAGGGWRGRLGGEAVGRRLSAGVAVVAVVVGRCSLSGGRRPRAAAGSPARRAGRPNWTNRLSPEVWLPEGWATTARPAATASAAPPEARSPRLTRRFTPASRPRSRRSPWRARRRARSRPSAARPRSCRSGSAGGPAPRPGASAARSVGGSSKV